ncbi:MAG: MFS transporter [Candidatus Atribacteria bacterium]|nr:MFS transporter [Candidatus Atribacteria bacterium]
MKVQNFFEDYSKLPRGIFILFFARIVHSIGNFVFPFLAIFLTKTLLFSEQKAGFFVMMATAAKIPGLLMGGKFSDILGRKKVFVSFSLLSALFILSCLFVEQKEMIPWLLALSAVFNGAIHPSMNAMVADMTNAENRKAAFSLLYLGMNIGFAVGPLIAGFLYNKYLQLIFIGDVATTVISVLLVFFFIEESIPSKEKIQSSIHSNHTSEKPEEGNLYRVLLSRPYLMIFSLVFTLYSFIYVQNEFTLPIQMMEIFGERGPQYFGSVMTVNGIVVIFMTVFIISLTRKIEPILNVSFAGILYAFGFGMIYFSQNMILFSISTILWTLGEIMASTYSDVYIMNHTPMSHRGRFSAIIHILIGSGYIFGPYLSGIYIGYYQMRNIWLIVFALSIISAFLMYIVYLWEVRSDQQQIKEYT